MPKMERPQMDGYGVPDHDEGLLPWSWAEQRLAGSRNFWLTTVSGDGRPHAMPVWGVWIPERERFGFSSAATARKVRNLGENDRCVVTNDDAVHVVSIEGRAERLSGDAVDRMGRAWVAKYADEPGFEDPDAVVGFLHDNAVYEIVPERAFGMIETPEDFSERATRWTW